MMSDDTSLFWRDCVRWMIDCGILDKHHRVAWASSEVCDLAQILRDGVLLCHLANRLVRGCIDQRELSLRPQLSQFLCLKNICLFLGVCQKSFGISQRDLFEAWELYKVSDFGKVLLTLSKLSKTDTALRTGIAGFPAKAVNSSAGEYYNSEIYRNLEEEAGNRELQENNYDVSEDEDQACNKIYDTLILNSKSAFSLPKEASKQEPVDFVPTDRRGMCLKELQDTELNYVEALNMIQNRFYVPLKDVLTPDEHSTMFMNILELAQIHTSFNFELRAAIRNCSQTGNRLGDVFVRWKSKLVVYSYYCSRLPTSRALIDRLENDSEFVKQNIAECGFEANKNQFRLQDLLSIPMQRVLKYHILLNELIKLTEIDHEDRPSLELARNAMMDINSYINEVKRDFEMKQVVIDMQKSIADFEMPENTILIDYGRLIKDGEIRIADHRQKDGNKLKNRYVFLFDKVMIICKNLKNNHYSYKSAQIVSEYKIEFPELENNTRFDSLRMSRRWLHTWSFVHIKGDNVLQMAVKSLDQKESWLKAIETANDNVNPAMSFGSDHDLCFKSYTEATDCSHCRRLLLGLFYQGYHCNVCGCDIHKKCIESFGSCEGGRQRERQRQRQRQSLHNDPGAFEVSIGEMVCAVRPYHASQPELLSFDEDDAILVLHIGSNGWLKGRISTYGRNRVGFFKSCYVCNSRRSSLVPNRRCLSSISSDCTKLPISSLPSNTSTETTTSQKLLPIRTDSTISSASLTNGHDYANTDLTKHTWYMGSMDRDDAHSRLAGLPDGAFLVRYSTHQDRHALSISYDREVKHMKVERGGPGGTSVWLDEDLVFPNLPTLVAYYRQHNLQESFLALDTVLRLPARDHLLGSVVVVYDFQSTNVKMLSLNKGDRVHVLDVQGEERGWWKGKIGSKIGYFPLSYVTPLNSDDSQMNLPNGPKIASSYDPQLDPFVSDD